MSFNMPPGVTISMIPGIDDRDVEFTIYITELNGESDYDEVEQIKTEFLEWFGNNNLDIDEIEIYDIQAIPHEHYISYGYKVNLTVGGLTSIDPKDDDSIVYNTIIETLNEEFSEINWNDYRDTIEYEIR